MLVLRIERISENGSIRLCLSGELRASDLKEVQTEIAKIAPRIVLDLAETDPGKAQSVAEEMARKLMANTAIESFHVVMQAEGQ